MHKIVTAAATCALAASSALAATPTRGLPHYDAFFASVYAERGARASVAGPAHRLTARLQEAGRGPRGYRSVYDARLAAHTFLWLHNGRTLAVQSAAVPLKRSLQADAIARAAIRSDAAALAVGRRSIDAARRVDVQDSASGPVIARFQQRIGDREVFNRRLAVLMDRQLTPKGISGYFAPGPATR